MPHFPGASIPSPGRAQHRATPRDKMWKVVLIWATIRNSSAGEEWNMGTAGQQQGLSQPLPQERREGEMNQST